MKFHFWYTTLSLFFVVFATFCYLWLAGNNKLTTQVPLVDLFLMALAVMRLVRLFTYDIITAFIRNWFVGADPQSFLGTLGMLIHCPWCTGLWFACMVVFFYLATPIAWYAILVLALASVATFFQLLANLIGWKAEIAKQKAQSSVSSR